MTLSERESFLMVKMFFYLTKRWSISTEQFLELDEQYGIMRLLRIGYEAYHLTGEEGIAEDVEEYIREQGGSI